MSGENSIRDVILKRFEQPDEIRTFEKGKFELLRLGGMTIGRATYEPGWKWSVRVGRSVGAKSGAVEQLGMVLSGRDTAAMDDGRLIKRQAGDVFYMAPGDGGRGAVRFAAFSGRGRIRQQEEKLHAD
jgi:hypothetical protein